MHESDAHEHRPEAQPPPQDAAPEPAVAASDPASGEEAQSAVADASTEPVASTEPEPAPMAESVADPEPAPTAEAAPSHEPAGSAHPEQLGAEPGTDAPVMIEPSADAPHEAQGIVNQHAEADAAPPDAAVEAAPPPALEAAGDPGPSPFDTPPEADRSSVAEDTAPVVSAESPVAEGAAAGAVPSDAPAPAGAAPLEQPADATAAEAAVAGAPAAEAPVAAAPAAEASVAAAPAAEAPAAAAPAAEAPAAAAPAAEAPVAAAPAADGDAAVEAPATETPPRKPQPSPQEIARNEERRKRAQQAWERVVNARESGEVLTGTVTTAVKGGLLVDVGGIRGFLPASQVRVPQGTAIDTLVKSKVPLKVIDVDQNRRRIVVSHRRAAEEERRTKRAEILRSLEVGQTREGTVVRLTDFGAFVDLGGVDGLIPMRELAFERVDKAGDVVKVGEVLPVEVLRIDENGKKISLSRRNALPDPWRDHADVLRQGKTVEGKVVGKEPRLQVEIAPGVVGTVREGDADPADYEIGEAIEVIVRRADRTTRRIMLSTTHTAAAAPPPQTTSSGFAPLGVELGRRT
jgi:predicted RNA-binding protein with RPS1 domain